VLPELSEFCHLKPGGREKVARNRYGWEKRTKELARKQKSEEKIKRRQNKAGAGITAVEPKTLEEDSSGS
jgi:hypothetical protein